MSRIFRRQTFGGRTFRGQTFRELTFGGQTFGGQTFLGQTFLDQTFRGRTFWRCIVASNNVSGTVWFATFLPYHLIKRKQVFFPSWNTIGTCQCTVPISVCIYNSNGWIGRQAHLMIWRGWAWTGEGWGGRCRPCRCPASTASSAWTGPWRWRGSSPASHPAHIEDHIKVLPIQKPCLKHYNSCHGDGDSKMK